MGDRRRPRWRHGHREARRPALAGQLGQRHDLERHGRQRIFNRSVDHRLRLADEIGGALHRKTGLAHDTSGLTIGAIADNEATPVVYTAAASHVEAISTLGTFAAPSASCCRFAQVDATACPGLYELQLPDARFAVAGAR